MTTIYIINNLKRQLIEFLKKYQCIIYVKNCLECKLQTFTLQ